jgi:AAA domain, putative AbiEii toxin, Type IV TA system
LTGMNSSGKSSFLGAIKYLSDIESFRTGGASFNKDPFYFGGFEQIVNHMGRRNSKSESFSIGFNGSLVEREGIHRRKPSKPDTVSFQISFARVGTQPVVERVKLSSRNLKIEIYVDYKNQMVSIEQKIGSETEVFELRNDMIPPDTLFNNVSMISFMYERLLRLQKPQKTSDRTNAFLDLNLELYERAELIRNALSSVPSTSFAGAPIRSRPSRTYDPTDVLPQAEGSHVPSQLAQLARQRPSEWQSIQASLNRFGEQSGLFKKIDVRALGKSESDPFQLEVSINGPKRNIVDVGYGVSQVFPLLFEALTRRSGELMMIQQPEVHLHPEAQAALGSFIVDDVAKKPGYYLIETHSDYLIDRIRQKIRAGDIDRNDVSLLYFSQDQKGSHISSVDLNENGDVVDPPKNYRDFFLREELNTLGF